MNELNKLLLVFLFSMVPVSELRGTIPIAVQVYDLPLWKAAVAAIAGNSLIGVLLVYLLPWLERLLSRYFRFLIPVFEFFSERTRRKHSKKIELYAEVGLFILVAVPLPATGAWTGALAAYIFGLDRFKSSIVITLGVITAGLIVSLLTAGIF